MSTRSRYREIVGEENISPGYRGNGRKCGVESKSTVRKNRLRPLRKLSSKLKLTLKTVNSEVSKSSWGSFLSHAETELSNAWPSLKLLSISLILLCFSL